MMCQRQGYMLYPVNLPILSSLNVLSSHTDLYISYVLQTTM